MVAGYLELIETGWSVSNSSTAQPLQDVSGVSGLNETIRHIYEVCKTYFLVNSKPKVGLFRVGDAVRSEGLGVCPFSKSVPSLRLLRLGSSWNSNLLGAFGFRCDLCKQRRRLAGRRISVYREQPEVLETILQTSGLEQTL
jgi:hypothetical protein